MIEAEEPPVHLQDLRCAVRGGCGSVYSIETVPGCQKHPAASTKPFIASLQANWKKGGPAFYETGPLRALPLHTERVPMGALCVTILRCSFVMLMISLCKLKVKRRVDSSCCSATVLVISEVTHPIMMSLLFHVDGTYLWLPWQQGCQMKHSTQFFFLFLKPVHSRFFIERLVDIVSVF